MALEFSKTADIKQTPRANKALKTPFSLAAKRVKNEDIQLFTEQLALMLETGTDLHTSLGALAKQTQNMAMQTVIEDVSEAVESGKSFAQSLAEHPEVFSQTYVGLVRASEEGGYLYRVLEHIYEMDKQQEELRTTIKSAFTYPAFLMFFSFAVVVFVLLVVFPKFKTLFASIHDQLPASTKVLMWLSDSMIIYWWAIVPAIVVILWGVLMWLRSEGGVALLDNIKLKMPLVRDVFQQAYLIQSMRVLGLSIQNGMPLIDAIESAKGVVKNNLFRRFLEDLKNNVTEGRTFASGFMEVDFIPPILKQMITTGETTGNLPLVMGRVAEQYQKDLDNKLKALSKAIEPVMLMVMGLVVGIIVSSLILPIFKLSRAVG